MSDPAVNEAAERLRTNLGLIPMQPERGLARLDLDAALDTERRNTVERIRALLPDYTTVRFNEEQVTMDDFAALLDEVAS